MGDCWFLAGLAVISERSDLIGRVLGGNSPVSDEVGCYEVNLFKDGRWERYGFLLFICARYLQTCSCRFVLDFSSNVILLLLEKVS